VKKGCNFINRDLFARVPCGSILQCIYFDNMDSDRELCLDSADLSRARGENSTRDKFHPTSPLSMRYPLQGWFSSLITTVKLAWWATASLLDLILVLQKGCMA
jgi:hypothetical protein